MLNDRELSFLEHARVGHLATADASAVPHVVPVCYAATAGDIYTPIDEKPKRGAVARLKRLRNIAANPTVAFVVDHYDHADWSRLGWVMAWGRAEIVSSGVEHSAAIERLRHRYGQYREMALDELPIIAVRISKTASWGRIDAPVTDRTPGEAT